MVVGGGADLTLPDWKEDTSSEGLGSAMHQAGSHAPDISLK